MEVVTTIKLRKSTKSALDTIKNKSESYDEAIRKLVSSRKNANLRSELINAYKDMGKNDLEVMHEWEVSSSEVEND